jgi:hypothetical protein
MKIKTLLLISCFLVSVSTYADFNPQHDPSMPINPKMGAGVVGISASDCCIAPTADIVRLGDVQSDYAPGKRPGKFDDPFTAPGTDGVSAPEL